MTVGDIIAACEYINCEVLDALGNPITVDLETYKLSVEHLSAKDNKVLIWTFDKLNKI